MTSSTETHLTVFQAEIGGSTRWHTEAGREWLRKSTAADWPAEGARSAPPTADGFGQLGQRRQSTRNGANPYNEPAALLNIYQPSIIMAVYYTIPSRRFEYSRAPLARWYKGPPLDR